MKIVNIIYKLAREHIAIKSFYYGRNYQKGVGSEPYPMIWLDDPISASANGSGVLLKTLGYSFNFDVLDVPKTDTEVIAIQTACESIGLSIIEQIKKQVQVDSVRTITLRDYYDNKSAGVRFSVSITIPNPVNLCSDDFNPEKQFDKKSYLPDFTIGSPSGCDVFDDKSGFPNINLNQTQ